MSMDKTILKSNISTDIGDNFTNAISAEDIRQNVLDIVDTVFDIPGETGRQYSQTITQGSSATGALYIDGTLSLGSGTTSRAPIKLISGATLSTPQAGAVEYDGVDMYFTNTSGTRNSIENASNKDQSYGYAGLDANANLVGPIIVRNLTASGLNSVTLASGELASTSDTHEVRMGDGAKIGGWHVSGAMHINHTAVAETPFVLPRAKELTVYLTNVVAFTTKPMFIPNPDMQIGDKVTIVSADIQQVDANILWTSEFGSSGITKTYGVVFRFTNGDLVLSYGDVFAKVTASKPFMLQFENLGNIFFLDGTLLITNFINTTVDFY